MPFVDFTLLRHTRASWWVQAGVPLAKVAKWMGHSINICARHYAGLQPGYDTDCERAPGIVAYRR
jgi:integrase